MSNYKQLKSIPSFPTRVKSIMTQRGPELCYCSKFLTDCSSRASCFHLLVLSVDRKILLLYDKKIKNKRRSALDIAFVNTTIQLLVDYRIVRT